VLTKDVRLKHIRSAALGGLLLLFSFASPVSAIVVTSLSYSGAVNTNALGVAYPYTSFDEVDNARGDSGGPSLYGGEVIGVHDLGMCFGNRQCNTLFPFTQAQPVGLYCAVERREIRSPEESALRKKVTVVGAGNVGANCAVWIANKELADVVLVDVVEGVPQGKGLDLLQAGPVLGSDVLVTGANDYGPTAGFPRKPGMSRDDLLLANYEIVRQASEQVARHSPNCVMIVVSNPLDAMCQTAYWTSKFPRNHVVGMAGVLDSARFRTFIAQELKVSVENVTAVVMGGHGDTMVPIVRLSSVSGIPLTELLDREAIDRIVTRTRNGGAEIVKYLKTGSAYYAPSASTVEMAESILKDKKKVLPCSAFLEGEYGINGLFVGVPVKLGAGGVEKIYEVKLMPEEQLMLTRSAEAVRELIDVLEKKRAV
jgi:malate dehydrogenase